MKSTERQRIVIKISKSPERSNFGEEEGKGSCSFKTGERCLSPHCQNPTTPSQTWTRAAVILNSFSPNKSQFRDTFPWLKIFPISVFSVTFPRRYLGQKSFLGRQGTKTKIGEHYCSKLCFFFFSWFDRQYLRAGSVETRFFKCNELDPTVFLFQCC